MAMDLENIMQDTIVIEARARERKGTYLTQGAGIEARTSCHACTFLLAISSVYALLRWAVVSD